MSDLVGNLEDQFSRVAAQIMKTDYLRNVHMRKQRCRLLFFVVVLPDLCWSWSETQIVLSSCRTSHHYVPVRTLIVLFDQNL